MSDITQTDDSTKPNPLDVLEEILDDAEEQKAARDKRLQELQEEADRKAKEAAAKQADLQQMAVQRVQMSKVGETPEEQARVSQIKAELEKKSQQQSEQKGFEIRQLGHTKI